MLVCVAAMSLVCLAGCYLSMIESLVITINIIVDAIRNVVPTLPFINNIFAFVKKKQHAKRGTAIPNMTLRPKIAMQSRPCQYIV